MADNIEHRGVVVEVNGKSVKVRIEQLSACAACHVRSLCMASDKSEKIVDAAVVAGNFSVGEEVVVVGHKQLGVVAVVLAYIVPFLLIVATLFFSSLFVDEEWIVGSLSLLVLAPYLVALRLMNNKIKAKFRFYVSKI